MDGWMDGEWDIGRRRTGWVASSWLGAFFGPITQGVALGWYGAGPLAHKRPAPGLAPASPFVNRIFRSCYGCHGAEVLPLKGGGLTLFACFFHRVTWFLVQIDRQQRVEIRCDLRCDAVARRKEFTCGTLAADHEVQPLSLFHSSQMPG